MRNKTYTGAHLSCSRSFFVRLSFFLSLLKVIFFSRSSLSCWSRRVRTFVSSERRLFATISRSNLDVSRSSSFSHSSYKRGAYEIYMYKIIYKIIIHSSRLLTYSSLPNLQNQRSWVAQGSGCGSNDILVYTKNKKEAQLRKSACCLTANRGRCNVGLRREGFSCFPQLAIHKLWEWKIRKNPMAS